METAPKIRHIERCNGAAFEPCTYTDLLKGDRFTLRDDGPDPVEDGKQIYLALGPAVPCEPEGNFVIDCCPYKPWVKWHVKLTTSELNMRELARTLVRTQEPDAHSYVAAQAGL